MIVYHASNHVFDKPNYEKLIANRTNHDNGALGLWCANEPDWVERFGKHTYEINFRGVIRYIGIGAFCKLCLRDPRLKEYPTPREYYQMLRVGLLSEGVDAIAIIEHTGEVDMLVILNFDIIDEFTLTVRGDA